MESSFLLACQEEKEKVMRGRDLELGEGNVTLMEAVCSSWISASSLSAT
jgi:hypothetical protein